MHLDGAEVDSFRRVGDAGRQLIVVVDEDIMKYHVIGVAVFGRCAYGSAEF